MPRGGSRPSTPGVIAIRPLSDEVLEILFRQSIVGHYKGEPYLKGVRRLARLIEVELQGQILGTIHRRASDARRRHCTVAA